MTLGYYVQIINIFLEFKNIILRRVEKMMEEMAEEKIVVIS